jgi:YjbE family integral membrane protein
MIDWIQNNSIALMNVIVIDVVLAGDNAIIVGLAASRVAPELRRRVIVWGIGGAVLLRLAFSAITLQLLAVVGLTIAGGLLLLWVCWKMARELIGSSASGVHVQSARTGASPAPPLKFRAAVSRLIVADLSMSLDNVLGVAGAAKGSPIVLMIGLTVGVVLTAIASNYIAALLGRYPWITWIGLLIIASVALSMIWDGWHQVERSYPSLWTADELWRAATGKQ